MKTTWGVLDPPVGNTRLNVVRLVASLLQSNTHSINTELINLNTLGVILVSTTALSHSYSQSENQNDVSNFWIKATIFIGYLFWAIFTDFPLLSLH